MIVTIKPKMLRAQTAAHAAYFVENTLKALKDLPMHGHMRKHIVRNLQDLQTLATTGVCRVHTSDQTRFVARKLRKMA